MQESLYKTFVQIAEGVLEHLEFLKEQGKDALPLYRKTTISQNDALNSDFTSPENLTVTKDEPQCYHPEEAKQKLLEIAERIEKCTACQLYKTRNKAVPGQGNPAPELMFVGEAPGMEEDRQGLAFVGAAGQVLTRLITKMGFSREEVFIANICKCHPPGITKANEKPTPEQMKACLHFLLEQIAILKPKVIVALGATAVEGLFGLKTAQITKRRGNWMNLHGIPVMPTFHPSYLLHNRSPELYWQVWGDMKKVLEFLGRPIPK